MKYLAFLIYIILWDGGLLLGTYYATFILGHSGWWWLLSIFLMLSSFKPHHFGLQDIKKQNNE